MKTLLLIFEQREQRSSSWKQGTTRDINLILGGSRLLSLEAPNQPNLVAVFLTLEQGTFSANRMSLLIKYLSVVLIILGMSATFYL